MAENRILNYADAVALADVVRAAWEGKTVARLLPGEVRFRSARLAPRSRSPRGAPTERVWRLSWMIPGSGRRSPQSWPGSAACPDKRLDGFKSALTDSPYCGFNGDGFKSALTDSPY